MAIDSKRITKNTLYMYARMLVVMIVAIFTSRVVLDKLGIDDYGLYNAISSVIAVVLFLNTTLSTSTSRFLTYNLGKGDANQLRTTFSTSFYTHLFLAGIVVVLMETGGLWYLNNKFVIPEGREFATQCVFQISLLTTAISIIQVPFTASIMAHEDMGVYAYIGLFEVFSKLAVVYLLSVSPIDKLIFYAALIAIIHVIIMVSYVIICKRKYSEINISERFSKNAFNDMIGFTGWTAVANLSNTLIVQGSILLLNLFFSPAIIAAKALANQVSHAIMGFITNFRVALNPQIIKSYAAEENEEFKKFTLLSTVISFDLMLILGLPCIFTMNKIFSIWLVEVPDKAVEFTQLAIFSQIINTISTSTYIPFVASGKLKRNAIWGTVMGFCYFVILYVIYKIGGGALWSEWLFLIVCCVSVLFLRPLLLHKELGFTYMEMLKYGLGCLKVLMLASIMSLSFCLLIGDSLWQQGLLFILVFSSAVFSSWIFLDRSTRNHVVTMIKSKFKRYK